MLNKASQRHKNLDSPYSHFRLVLGFIKHWLRAKNAHGIHSPEVFTWYTKILHGSERSPQTECIEKQRLRWKKDSAILDYNDPKTGLAKSIARNRLVKGSAKTEKLCQVLYRSVKAIKPVNALELGTNFGISLAYQQSASTNPITSIEGVEELTQLADTTLRNCNLQAKLISGLFKDNLPKFLDQIEELDYAYLDGDHSYAATLEIFEAILKKSTSKSVFIFDDIHWSPGMEKAWSEICQNKSVSISLDCFHLGIIFTKRNVVKQHFSLRL